ncbi:ZIP family metal transporter [Pseudomonas sp. ABC1]|uniref:ZIP family metal transporter n=1 Tax=Pseudomonas sp. ABC1 TaxID=2748080 RepID=UPI0015C2F7D5|nr:ZIP family metal transporter [Pseudomonas sp. ABC1]QLF94472.1 ZIP family metal transporter [Pseudomonas sp. ABC1]
MRTVWQTLTASNVRIFRYMVGFSLVLGGVGVLLAQAASLVPESIEPQIWRALRAGMLCALGTALGALPVLFIRNISARMSDVLLGLGGGIMLAATVFSLLIPALDVAGEQGYTPWGAAAMASIGLLIGASALLGFGRLLPMAQGAPDQVLGGRVSLFVIAIVAHNIPEGMAVGVAAGAGLDGADSLALGIALQDVPEGLIVALLLAGVGVSRWKALMIGVASGLVEPVFAVLCAWLVGVSAQLLPWGLALAAGAMLFAVAHEIIPESHRNGHATEASLALAVGFCLMMALDTALV